MRWLWGGLIIGLVSGLAGFVASAEEPGAGEITVTDVDGKEHRLSGVKFGVGTKRLAWLADPNGAGEDARRGPIALEVRELTSAMPLAKGIVTLVPIASIESIRYEFEKGQVHVAVKGLSQPLAGALFYPRVNVIGLSGTSEMKSASFIGGTRDKPTVKFVTLTNAQPLVRKRSGKSWNIQIVKTRKDEPMVVDSPTLTVRNLRVLVSQGVGIEQLVDGLSIRKGTPVLFDDNMNRFELLANDLNTNYAAAEIETTDGTQRVIAIPLGSDKDMKTLVGLLGEVDAGWKLFPLHTIQVITPSKRKIE